MIREVVRDAVERAAGDQRKVAQIVVRWLETSTPSDRQQAMREIAAEAGTGPALQAACDEAVEETGSDLEAAAHMVLERFDARENPAFHLEAFTEMALGVYGALRRIVKEEIEAWKKKAPPS